MPGDRGAVFAHGEKMRRMVTWGTIDVIDKGRYQPFYGPGTSAYPRPLLPSFTEIIPTWH